MASWGQTGSHAWGVYPYLAAGETPLLEAAALASLEGSETPADVETVTKCDRGGH